MIDALNTSALAGQSVGTGLPAQADFKDVERFRAAMMAPQSQAQQPTVQAAPAEVTPQQPPPPAAAVLPSPLVIMPSAVAPPTLAAAPNLGAAPAKPSGSLGETLVNTMNDLSTDTRQRFEQVGQLLSQPNLTMSDLMSMQFTLLQTSIQFEIASKGISKVTQNLDSILKTQ